VRKPRRRGLNQPIALVVSALVWAASAQAANAPNQTTPPALLKQMEGKWTVAQKMWPGRGQGAVELPPAVAQRHLIQNSFLQEVMEPSQAGAPDSFNRTAYFAFNPTTHKFEYFSLDSRMPQMMNERSAAENPSTTSGQGINLQGGHFVAPVWGKARNVPFRYRLVVGAIKDDRQTVRLFLTPESGSDRQAFLAFEYQYTRAL
jgi:hypothetical protein